MCHEGWRPDARAGATVEIDIAASTGDRLPVFRFVPPQDTTPRAPCVVLTDIFGAVPFYHEVSHRLAVAGHPTFLLDSCGREGRLAELTREAAFARRGRMDEPLAIADAGDVVAHAAGLHGAERVGVVGFCIGGLFAMNLAADRDDIVAVSFYGFPEGIAAPVRVAAPRPIDRVDEMTSPILAFWGDDDHNVPVDQIERFRDATDVVGVDCEVHLYEGVGHGFLQGVVEERNDSAVARQAWTRTVEVLADRAES